jgi:Concanavalin A-like lectin/glucanases superfamily
MSDPGPLDLVLHHQYGSYGLRDVSGHDNHGFGPLNLAEGQSPSSSAISFDGQHDRVYVPPSPSLAASGDIRSEVTVNLDELGHRRTLMEGYLALAVEGDGSLAGAVMRYRDWYGTRSEPGVVAPGRWLVAMLQYTSDGLMVLAVDGAQVATAVRPVGPANGVEWPFGLNIGAWPDGDQRLIRGRVEEVRLWRGSPSAASRVTALDR